MAPRRNKITVQPDATEKKLIDNVSADKVEIEGSVKRNAKRMHTLDGPLSDDESLAHLSTINEDADPDDSEVEQDDEDLLSEDNEEFNSEGESEELEWSEISGEDDGYLSSDQRSNLSSDDEKVLTPAEKYLAQTDSEDDDFSAPATTIGNVPLEWYEDYPHIGYDLDGKRVVKPATKDELDALLERMDDPKFMATFRDNENHRDVALTNEELEIIKKLQNADVPHADYDPYPEFDEPFVRDTMTQPLIAPPEPKSRFIRSKWEHGRIMKIVKAIRKGLILPKKPKQKEGERLYDIWKDKEEESEQHPLHITAPKLKLPDHSESYNPPEEYLFNDEEKEKWNQLDAEDREQNYVPQKYSNMRSIPGYQAFINERFARCLDLYLCPRTVRKRVIDPESLLPKLPDPKDLEPFPKYMAITFDGHTDKIRTMSVDPSGQWLISGSDDKTVRLWEVCSGKCIKVWEMEDAVLSVAWNPNKSISIFAVSTGKMVHIFVNPEISNASVLSASEAVFSVAAEGDDKDSLTISWTKPSAKQNETGCRMIIRHTDEVTQVVWHRRGDYFATVAPQSGSQSVHIHQLTKQSSQNPFKKSKGQVQKVAFHPSKPLFYVATQTYVRIYNLVRQELEKKLNPGAKWISSLDIHPGGDNVIVGTYDKKTCWFDLDIGAHPYQVQRGHQYAVRNVTFHKKLPLFASCSDDGTVQIYHGMVYNDYMQNPLIVPVKKLIKTHTRTEGLGVLHCEFHPTQPWIFTCGADGKLKLFS